MKRQAHRNSHAVEEADKGDVPDSGLVAVKNHPPDVRSGRDNRINYSLPPKLRRIGYTPVYPVNILL